MGGERKGRGKGESEGGEGREGVEGKRGEVEGENAH